jgi:NAD(P)H-hydrate epimerase
VVNPQPRWPQLRWHRRNASAEEIAGKRVVTAAEMRAAETALFARGIPSFEVMSLAGRAVVGAIQSRWPGRFQRAVVLCGPGNNGGDGFIVATELAALGWSVHLAAAFPRDGYQADAACAAALWGGEIAELRPGLLRDAAAGDTVIVDAVFGIGLGRPLDGVVRAVIEELDGQSCPVVAVDLPSGIDADTGAILGAAPKAALTVTFGWPKPGHLLLPGRDRIGDLAVAEIGCRAADLPAAGRSVRVNGPPVWRHALPIPKASDHKYTRGHAVMIGGAEMPGATKLAARAARRIGIGMLTVAAAPSVLAIYLADQPGLIVRDIADLGGLLGDRRVTAILVGSGLPPSAATRAQVEAVAGSSHAAVVDGGGLTAFAGDAAALARFGRGNIVLTPHEGEFARLFPHLNTMPSKLARVEAAAAESQCTVILKGADTVIATPEGQAAINVDAPAWLATAGSGDILAGLVTGLLGQGMPAFEAAAAAVSLHGMAGTAFGPGLIAEDLSEQLPSLLRRFTEPDAD